MPTKTPASVRVARWAAVAAAITAVGSVFNTVWTERPWWKEAPMVARSVQVQTAQTMSSLPAPMQYAKWLLIGCGVVALAYVAIELWHRYGPKKD